MHYSKQSVEGVITFHDFLDALRVFMYSMIRVYFTHCLLTIPEHCYRDFFHIHSQHLREHFKMNM